MAASASTAYAVAGSTSLTSLSSKAAFGNAVVQGAPVVRPAGVARVAGIRASSNNSEESRPARREVLAGILAAGAALGFPNQASAAMNPLASAKSKANQAVQGAKDVAGKNPLNNMTAMKSPVGDVQSAVEEASSGLKRRIDGLFGKDKAYPQRDTQVTGKGAVADARGRVSSFLNKSQNPLATNLEKATNETAATGPNSASARAGKEFLGKDSTRVDEATGRVNAGAEKLQGKAVQAFDDATGAAKDAAGAAQDATPGVQAPGTGVFKGLASKIKGAKGDVASKAEEVKSMLPGQ